MFMNFKKLPQLRDVRQSLTKHSTRVYRTRNINDIKKLAIHHSATKTGSAEAYARYHVNNLGWGGIGYHFVVEQDGTIKWCNSLETVSYHVGNSNGFAVGICMTGDFRFAEPTPEQWKSVYELVLVLMDDLNLKAEDVLQHQEFAGYSNKPCASIDMTAFRNNLIEKKSTPVEVVDKSVPNPDVYTVQQGDTLWQIAHNHDGLDVDDILRLNPEIVNNIIHVGQKIRLKDVYKKVTQKPVNTTTQPKYVVKKGDTLWSIAIAHKTTVAELEKLNKGINAESLSIGQEIFVKSVTTPTPKPQPKPVPVAIGNVETLVNLNVRSGAGLSYRVLRTLPKGTRVVALEEKNGFYRIGKDEWVSASSDFVRKVTAQKRVEILVHRLNVRSDASLSARVVRTVSKGQSFNVLEEKNGMIRIAVGQWISGNKLYVKVV